MPIIQSAKKRVKTTARQTEENRLHRSRSRTAIKEVRDLAAAGKTSEALARVSIAQSYLDKAAKLRAFHPNTVARYKSNLAAALKAAGNKDPVGKKAVKPKATKAAKKPAAKADKATPKKAPAKPAPKQENK